MIVLYAWYLNCNTMVL